MNEDVSNYITVAGRQLPLIAKKHPRAKSMVVRYDVRRQCLRLTLPRYVPLKAGIQFVISKAGWIAAQMNTQTTVPFEDGAEIPLFGEMLQLQHIGGRGLVKREGNIVFVPGEKEFMARRVRNYIQQEMKTYLITQTQRYANTLGVKCHGVTLRETSSHWGSCSSKGRLSFCWRLAFAPLEVLEYIVCHEVSHLLHHNHSARYWQTVARLYPHYEAQERWLKRHGQSLWAYG